MVEKSIYPDMYVKAHSSTIHNNQNVETTHHALQWKNTAIKRGLPYNAILLSHKTE
jgi:hypothetical protein